MKRTKNQEQLNKTHLLNDQIKKDQTSRIVIQDTQALYQHLWELLVSLPVEQFLRQLAEYQTLAKQEAGKDIDESNLEALHGARERLNPLVETLTKLDELIERLEKISPGKFAELTELYEEEFTQEELISRITQEWQIDDQSLITKIIAWVAESNCALKDHPIKHANEEIINESTNKLLHVKAKPVSDIVLPDYTNAQIDQAIRTFNQLLVLNEFVVPVSSGHIIEELKELLSEQYQSIICTYAQWSESSKEDIYAWAIEKKGKFALNLEQVCELIAVMNRANELITGGHKLRDSQILSLLVFMQNAFSSELDNDNMQGRLCEIHTGEGKTTIVSMLSIIQAMQGLTVDVITSNNILAAASVTEKANLYNLFGLTVATNNPVTGIEAKEVHNCYTADIVYGSIGNFQFDYLKDVFLEQNTRVGREFGVVILDEVDSMLIDNGRHIAKLASPFAGMESLRYVYIKIWQALEQLTKDMPEYDLSSIELQLRITPISLAIKQQIEEDKLLLDLIPQHLQDYVDRQIEYWIGNAIQAKYFYKENQQYIIKISSEKEGEKVIVPVDYLNTGVSLKNTVWPNGLHQFLQLKHCLAVTIETLTNAHISNMGYIKKYINKIYGMTGTLGSSAEKKLLSQIYKVDTAEIPTYKDGNFIELPARVIEDEKWLDVVILSILKQIEANRSVLVICETIEAVGLIKKNLELFNSLEEVHENDDVPSKPINKIAVYIDDDQHITENQIHTREVIIATNIAGRGTDLQTTLELENNGGLHVCVSFLPCNQRVEDQAFGRTSRQGKAGTAELVIKKTEIERLGLEFSNDMNANALGAIKAKRADIEAKKLEALSDKAIALDFQDMLCDSFIKLYKSFKAENSNLVGLNFLLEDLKELWAFWLEKNVVNHELQQPIFLEQKVQELLEKFKSQAEILLTGQNIDSDGNVHQYRPAERIIQNPYNAVKQAEFYLQNNDLSNRYLEPAIVALKQSIKLGGDGKIASSYLKLFESKITGNNLLGKKFANILAEVFHIKEPILGNTNNHLEEAESFLQQAKASVEHEILYLKKLLTTEMQINPTRVSSAISKDSILKTNNIQAELKIITDPILFEFSTMTIARNLDELRQILSTFQSINNGEIVQIDCHIMRGLDVYDITQPVIAIISLTKDQSGKLKISFYNQHSNKIPYQIKWELSKYCYFIEEAFYKEHEVIEGMIGNSNSVLLEGLLSHNLLFKHLYAKLAALSLQMDNIDALEIYCNNQLDDLLVARKFNALEKIVKGSTTLTKSDINELINIGLGQNYNLKSIADAANLAKDDYNHSEITQSIDMIKKGVTLLKLVEKLPFFGKHIEHISHLLIIDGITQIAMNLLNQTIDHSHLVAKVINDLEIKQQDLAGTIKKILFLSIKKSQTLAKANIELPELSLAYDSFDDTSQTIESIDNRQQEENIELYMRVVEDTINPQNDLQVNDPNLPGVIDTQLLGHEINQG